eukprot:960777-Prymnesium_polylepis.1
MARVCLRQLVAQVVRERPIARPTRSDSHASCECNASPGTQHITRLVTRSVTQVALCHALQVPLYHIIRNIGRYQVRNPVV